MRLKFNFLLLMICGLLLASTSTVAQNLDDFACSGGAIVERMTSEILWSPDGEKLAVASMAVDSSPCTTDAKVEIINRLDGEVMLTLQAGLDTITGLAWSPDSSQLATTDFWGIVRNWNVSDGQLLAQYPIFPKPLTEISWNADGQYWAIGGFDNIIYIIDSVNGETIHTINLGTPLIPGLADGIRVLDWSPDGMKLASTGVDGVIRIFDASTFEELQDIQTNSTRLFADWSPDSTQIASTGDQNDIEIWDVETGQKTFTILGHTDLVNAVTWSPDGLYIASTSPDTTVRIWNATTGEQVNLFRSPSKVLQTLHIDWNTTGELAYGLHIEFRMGNDPGSALAPIILPMPTEDSS